MSKGFTLVELLAVIIILSIIATITIVATNSVIDDSKRNLSDRQKKTIEEAAESYYLKEGMLENTSENVNACVNLSYLIDKGYVESSEVIDPKTKEAMNGSVKISYNSNQYDYEYNEALCSTCTLIDSDSNKKYSIGDIVSCKLSKSTERFYVIENEDEDTTDGIDVLSEKNINATGTGDIIQMDDAGTVDFSTTNYWSSSTFGTYIYNESNDIVKPIVDEYVNYLNEKLTNATGNLLSYDQATYLGCDNSLHNCSSNDLAGGPVLNPAPEWLYSRTFWVGSVFGSTDVFIIDSEGFFTNGYYTDSFGIRPVITISKSDIS